VERVKIFLAKHQAKDFAWATDSWISYPPGELSRNASRETGSIMVIQINARVWGMGLIRLGETDKGVWRSIGLCPDWRRFRCPERRNAVYSTLLKLSLSEK